MQSEASTRPPEGEESSRTPELNGHAVIRFAAFELRTETRELFKQGTRIRLQIKPFQVLETLLERPGELVTREELRNRLWPSGTFVDFESGLNTAINRLRSALGDSADEPRYIETLPRLGYRFVCPVEMNGHETRAEAVASLEPHEPVVAQLDSAPDVAFVAPAERRRNTWRWMGAGGAAAAVIVLGFWGAHSYFQPAPDFRLMNFRGAGVYSARFVSDSEVVYSARVDSKWQTLVSRLDGSDAHALAVNGVVMATSTRGDVAIISPQYHDKAPNQISRSNLKGAPQTLLEADAEGVDWTPDGNNVAVIRQRGSERMIEFPEGNVVYRTDGWLDALRVSRDGKQVAFLEHPERDDDAGHVRIADRSGATRVLGPEFGSAVGLAWGPHDDEVWFTAAREGATRSLYSVSLSGRLKKLSRPPLSLRLLDVSASGHALVAADENRLTTRTAVQGEETDISQFDYTDVEGISRDGRMLLMTESGDAGGLHYISFVYDLHTRNARRLGLGRALSLSADKSQVLTLDPADWSTLSITCLQSGRVTRVPGNGFRYQWARFLSGDKALVGGSFKNQPLFMGRENLHTGEITPIEGAPYMDHVIVSPDATKVAGLSSGLALIFDLDTKSVTQLPQRQARPVAWSLDGNSIYLLSEQPTVDTIMNYNPATKQCSVWKTIVPQDAAAFAGFAGVAAAPESGAYAYSAHLRLSRLYLVDGLL